MYCSECGKEISEDSEFCGYCGTTVPAAAAKASQAGQPPAPSPGPSVQPGQYPAPKKKSALPWIFGGVGVLVVVAVVLVLVFVVFGGGGDTSGPEEVVETLWEAFEQRDVDMLFSTMEPSYASALKDALGADYKQLFEDYFFIAFPDDMKVTIKKIDTEINGDEAVVTVVDGTMTYTDEYGDKVTEEASETDIESVDLVKVDGKWYISNDMWLSIGMDPDRLKDMADEEDKKTSDEDEDGKTTPDDSDAAQTEEACYQAMLDFARKAASDYGYDPNDVRVESLEMLSPTHGFAGAWIVDENGEYLEVMGGLHAEYQNGTWVCRWEQQGEDATP